MIYEKYCVFDIETNTLEKLPNPDVDELRYVGFKTYKGTKIVLHVSEKEKIQAILDHYVFLVGHNIEFYDIPVMERYGFKFNRPKVYIDTFQIADKRLKAMLYIDLNQGGRGLDALCKRFDLTHKKGEFDYSLLRKEKLEGEEYDLLVEYLHGDLDSGDDLFKFFYEFFCGFREFMSEHNKHKLSWLKCSPGATAYKAICNIAGIPEEYRDDEERSTDVQYDGGYVSEPYISFVQGNIYAVDFASLYPHMMMGFCLYNKAKKGYFTGSEIYPSVYGNDEDGIRGKYARNMGKIEQAIQLLFQKRMEVTEAITTAEGQEKTRLTNLRLAIKILINTMYGILGNPTFKSVADLTAASDCTALARRTIKHARTTLERLGYECLYTDTDSVYLVDPFNDEKKLRSSVDYISTWQRSCMSVPIESHQLVVEAKIKRIYFFRDDDGKFLKKHYIFVTDDDKIKVKGMKVIKGDCSPLAKQFFDEVIKRDILDNTYKSYQAEDLLTKLREFSVGREDQLVKRYRVNAPETYKIPEGKEEANCLSYQIAKRYGAGEHWMVINKRIGVGKGDRYATIEELKSKYGEMWIDQVCFERYLRDLKEFIVVKERSDNTLHKIDRKRKQTQKQGE